MLFYFLSTYAQSLAAFLGILVTVYVFSKSVFGRECQDIMTIIGQIRTGNPNNIWTGTVEEALRDTEMFIGSGSPQSRAGDKAVLKVRMEELRAAQSRLDDGIRFGAIFPELLAGVTLSIVAIALVPLASKHCLAAYAIPVVFVALLVRIALNTWRAGKAVFRDALAHWKLW